MQFKINAIAGKKGQMRTKSFGPAFKYLYLLVNVLINGVVLYSTGGCY